MIACFWLLVSYWMHAWLESHASVRHDVADLIANIEANERLYENIEVNWRKIYQLDRDKYPHSINGLYLRKVFTAHVIRQGRMFRDSYSEEGTSEKGPTLPVIGTNSYDGRRTIQTVSDIVNLHDRDSRYCDYFISHVSLTANGMIANCLPLSTWLCGRAAIESHPFGKVQGPLFVSLGGSRG